MFKMFTNWGPGGDLPDVGNVLDSDTVGGVAGTFANVSVSNVRDGTFWGEDGTEFEGTLSVTGISSIFFLMRRRP